MNPRTVSVALAERAWTRALPQARRIAREAAAAARGSTPGEIAVRLASDEEVRLLNLQFRGKDAATNVLAFPSAQSDRLGDLALAFDVCAEEATVQGKALADHLRHLIVHGVLHLLGMDHQSEAEAEEMEERERTVLAGLGVADPYALEAVNG